MNDELSFTPGNGTNNQQQTTNNQLKKSNLMPRIDEIYDDEQYSNSKYREYAVVDIDEDTLNEFDLQATQLLMKPREFETPLQVPNQSNTSYSGIIRKPEQMAIPTINNSTQNTQKRSYFANFKSQKPDLSLQLEQVF